MSAHDAIFKRPNRAAEFFFFFGEWISMYLCTTRGPGRLARVLYRLPIVLDRIGVRWIFSPTTLLITTTGRKSGLPRTTPLSYTFEPGTGIYYVVSGWAENSHWYRNLRADPNVRIKVGRWTSAAVAESVSDEKSIALIEDYNRRNPFAERVWPHLTGQPFNGSPEGILELMRSCPMIGLRPVANQPTGGWG